MSDTMDFGFDPKLATAFNSAMGEKIGWAGNLPEGVLKVEPQLRAEYTTEEFAHGVFEIQRVLFEEDDDAWDGKLGRGTWSAILRRYDRIKDGERYVVHNGRRLLIPDSSQGYQVINFDQPGGLDLHKYGDFSKGRREKQPHIHYLVLHWGGSSAKGLARVLANKGISSHFGIQKGTVYQFVDTWHRTWHAGFNDVNALSVGIDFCQQPTEKWAKRLQDKGWDVKLVGNPTKRGDKKITTLNPESVTAGRAFVEDLCNLLGIPFQFPRGKNGLEGKGPFYHGVVPMEALQDGTFKGVIGHHHVKETKWDIACWWDQLFGDLG